MKVVVVGLGLLGGSFALAIKKYFKTAYVWGVDKNDQHCLEALSLGIVDEINSLEKVFNQADWIILATPVDTIPKQLVYVLDHVKESTVVFDLGSTKHNICESVKNHPKRKHYISAHPIAGTEYSGPQAAFADLIHEKIMIICNANNSDKKILQKAIKLYQILGMKISFMESKVHDLHLAFISHLSHITSFALSNTVLDENKNEKTIFEMAGTGFDSTVRLAKSDLKTWVPIFQQNKKSVLKALKAHITQLDHFQTAIQNDDKESLENLIRKGNRIKNILK